MSAERDSSTHLEVAVKALIVRRGRVLLLKRRADAVPAPGGWDTPGGRLAFGESLEGALHREVHEELGPARLHVLQVLNAWAFPKDQHTHLVGITFLCDLEGEPELPRDSEHARLEWIPAARAVRLRQIGAPLRETIATYLMRRRGLAAVVHASRRIRTRGTASGRMRARRG